MNNTITATKIKNEAFNTQRLLTRVLEEIKHLRRDMSFAIPGENLEDYAHPNRVKKSFQKALKKYPPELWR